MPIVRPSKPVRDIQTFGDACGRCSGSGSIDTLGLGEPGMCPVCKGTGIARVLETFGNRESSLPRAAYADGVQVSTTGPGRRRTARNRP